MAKGKLEVSGRNKGSYKNRQKQTNKQVKGQRGPSTHPKQKGRGHLSKNYTLPYQQNRAHLKLETL